jgi:outer membrane murein-binding lipoprotein Lpp
MALAVAFGSLPGLAQEGYSDAKLESFASAVLAVNAIVEKWQPQIQAATSDEQAETMASEANDEMRAAVDGVEGITVDEYQEIAQAAQADPELMGRLDAIMGEKLND